MHTCLLTPWVLVCIFSHYINDSLKQFPHFIRRFTSNVHVKIVFFILSVRSELYLSCQWIYFDSINYMNIHVLEIGFLL
jgi:hypothetical protein